MWVSIVRSSYIHPSEVAATAAAAHRRIIPRFRMEKDEVHEPDARVAPLPPPPLPPPPPPPPTMVPTWRPTINFETWRRGLWSDLSMHYHLGSSSSQSSAGHHRQWHCNGNGHLLASLRSIHAGEVIAENIPIASVILLPGSRGSQLARDVEECPLTLMESVGVLHAVRSFSLHERDFDQSHSFNLWNDAELVKALYRLSDQWTLRMRKTTSTTSNEFGKYGGEASDQEAICYEIKQFHREYHCECSCARTAVRDEKERNMSIFTNRSTLPLGADEVDPLTALLPHALEMRTSTNGTPLAIIFPGELVRHAIQPSDTGAVNARVNVAWENRRLVVSIVASKNIKVGEVIHASLVPELAVFNGYDRCARFMTYHDLKLQQPARMVRVVQRLYDEIDLMANYPHMVTRELVRNLTDTILVLMRYAPHFELDVTVLVWLRDYSKTRALSHDARALIYWTQMLLRLL